jgi:hypothetical protein
MSLSAMAGSIIGNVKLRPRFGSRPLVVMGMVSSGGGLLYLTRLQPESGYWADIFPALLVAGIGLGIVASSAFNGATLGVSTSDAGVASATVNAMQQIGGSLGIAVLSTVALTATSNYLVAHHSRNAIASAMVHGYTVASVGPWRSSLSELSWPACSTPRWFELSCQFPPWGATRSSF